MENRNILKLPSLEYFGSWDDLQYYLEKKGNPLYSIEGNLNLSYDNLTSLGNLVSIGGNLHLRASDIKDLGNLTSVGGRLDLVRCFYLTSLGNLTSVGGKLDLRHTNIESLGNLTSVGIDLYLKNTPISDKYSEDEIRKMVDIGRYIYL
jgi:hypothetical protein